MQQFLTLVVFMCAMFIVMNIVGKEFRKQSRTANELAYYQATYQNKQGYSEGFGNYDLRTFDGGKKWYAVTTDSTGAVSIKGEADKVFPGLMKHLRAIDELMKYANTHGPINPDSASPEAVRILNDAGITVHKAN